MFQTLDSDNRYKPLRLYNLTTKSLIIYMRNLGDIKVTWLMGDKASWVLRGNKGVATGISWKFSLRQVI